MWILLFILAIVFVLGTALMLLRSARLHKAPPNVIAQPYNDEDDD